MTCPPVERLAAAVKRIRAAYQAAASMYARALHPELYAPAGPGRDHFLLLLRTLSGAYRMYFGA